MEATIDLNGQCLQKAAPTQSMIFLRKITTASMPDGPSDHIRNFCGDHAPGIML